MKLKKIYLFIILLLPIALFTTGCETDSMDNIDIIVTGYPSEYITSELYGEHSTIENIYPDGVNTEKYKISKKQKNDFAKKDLFIYNGLIEKERNLAIDLLEINKNLKIIDTAYVLETEYSYEELWLNPSSLLMMSENVKIGLKEYATSTYLKNDIEEKYEKLKINLSELDALYREAANNATYKTILVNNSALQYLEKFDLNVICIDDNASDKTINQINKLIKNKEIRSIFKFKNEKLSDNANKLIENYPDLKQQELHKLDIITDEERANKSNYIEIMEDNLNTLKQELY